MKLIEYFSNPSKWTKESNFRTSDGKRFDIAKENLILNRGQKSLISSCCLWGAIQYCYDDIAERNLVLSKFQSEWKTGTDYILLHIVDWNDSDERTFDDIKQLVNKLDI